MTGPPPKSVPRGPTPLRRYAELVVPSALVAACWVSSDYVSSYGLFALTAVTASWAVHRYAKPLLVAISAYLLLALLNLSSWRGDIEPYTIKMYALSLLALYLPFVFTSRRMRLRVAPLSFRSTVKLIAIGHILVAFTAVGFLYATHGVIILHQDLRFGIPAALWYVVTSPLPLAALAPLFFRNLRPQLTLVVMSILPTLLIGVRASALVALLAFALTRTYVHGASGRRFALPKRATLVGLVTVSVLVISLGFYGRRSGTTALLTPSAVARIYFGSDASWVYAVMPLYLGFRETTGLTNAIITGRISNDVNEVPLIVADLYTVLPGEQLDAGQSLGRIFGSVDAGGLTPGLLGGVYIDFGEYALAAFFIVGAVLACCVAMAARHHQYVPIYAVLLSQALHLFHRGFLKPEYFTTVAIVAFYAFAARPRAATGSHRPRAGGDCAAEWTGSEPRT
jgi:hypothetical protein